MLLNIKLANNKVIYNYELKKIAYLLINKLKNAN